MHLFILISCFGVLFGVDICFSWLSVVWMFCLVGLLLFTSAGGL